MPMIEVDVYYIVVDMFCITDTKWYTTDVWTTELVIRGGGGYVQQSPACIPQQLDTSFVKEEDLCLSL